MYTFYFEKLEVWKDSKELVKDIYKVTKDFPGHEAFGLTSQLRRAVISIPTNLAEGTSRSTKRDQANFTSISYSSLMEVLNLLILSQELDFINKVDYDRLRNQAEKIANKLIALRKAQLKAS